MRSVPGSDRHQPTELKPVPVKVVAHATATTVQGFVSSPSADLVVAIPRTRREYRIPSSAGTPRGRTWGWEPIED